jgi:hypothetical protein
MVEKYSKRKLGPSAREKEVNKAPGPCDYPLALSSYLTGRSSSVQQRPKFTITDKTKGFPTFAQRAQKESIGAGPSKYIVPEHALQKTVVFRQIQIYNPGKKKAGDTLNFSYKAAESKVYYLKKSANFTDYKPKTQVGPNPNKPPNPVHYATDKSELNASGAGGFKHDYHRAKKISEKRLTPGPGFCEPEKHM